MSRLLTTDERIHYNLIVVSGNNYTLQHGTPSDFDVAKATLVEAAHKYLPPGYPFALAYEKKGYHHGVACWYTYFRPYVWENWRRERGY